MGVCIRVCTRSSFSTNTASNSIDKREKRKKYIKKGREREEAKRKKKNKTRYSEPRIESRRDIRVLTIVLSRVVRNVKRRHAL